MIKPSGKIIGSSRIPGALDGAKMVTSGEMRIIFMILFQPQTFRIRRGVDECAVESIAVESFPIP